MRDKKKFRIVLLLAFSLLMGISSIDIFLSSLPQMARDFNASVSEINLMLSMFSAGLAVGCPFCGFLSDRFGRRSTYLTATISYTLLALAIALLKSLTLIIILRFIQGAVTSFFIIVSRQIVTDMCDEREQVAYSGILLVSNILSPAIAPVLGAYLSYYFDWQACLYFGAIFGVLMLMAVYYVLPETISAKQPLPQLNKLAHEYQVFLKSKNYWIAILVIGLNYGAFFAFITMSSHIYIDKLHMDSRLFSKLFIVLAATYLVGNSVMRALNRARMPILKIAWLGIWLSMAGALCGLLYVVNNNPLWIIVWVTISAAIMRAAYAILLAPAQVFCMSLGLGRQGVAVGTQYFFLYVLGALSSMLVSALSSYPIAGTMITITVLVALSLGLFMLLPSSIRNKADGADYDLSQAGE